MASNVSDWIAITIPVNDNTSAAEDDTQLHESIASAVKAVIAITGGATVTPVTGSWLSDDGTLYEEEGERYQFNFQRSKFADVQAATKSLVDALFDRGELAVFRERHYVESGYNASILHAPTRH